MTESYPCEHCGKEIVYPGRGHRRRYCNTRCRQKANEVFAQARKREKRAQIVLTLKCKRCGEPIPPERDTSHVLPKYCSEHCVMPRCSVCGIKPITCYGSRTCGPECSLVLRQRSTRAAWDRERAAGIQRVVGRQAVAHGEAADSPREHRTRPSVIRTREERKRLLEASRCKACGGPIGEERDKKNGPLPRYCSDFCNPWSKRETCYSPRLRPPNPNAVRLLDIARANDARWRAENPGVRMSQSVFLARMRERRG